MRAFVTGIGGFAGAYLARELLARGYAVHGLVRERCGRGQAAQGAKWAPVGADVAIFRADVTRYGHVREALRASLPDVIYHLAAVACPPRAEAHPARAFAVNVVGTVNVLTAAREVAPACRVVIVSSGDVYGRCLAAGAPFTEDAPLRPVGVYGISKAAAEMAALGAHSRWGQDVIVLRPFNHTGAGQSARFVCPAFARQLAEIEAGLRDPVVSTGDLESIRDFTDVRDVVEAYVRLAESAAPCEVYNICSGRGVRVAEVLDELVRIANLGVSVRPGRRRPTTRPVENSVGCYEKARRACGWWPRRELKETLAELLHYWRQLVRGRGSAGGAKLT